MHAEKTLLVTKHHTMKKYESAEVKSHTLLVILLVEFLPRKFLPVSTGLESVNPPEHRLDTGQ
jgi:hypothetical protein